MSKSHQGFAVIVQGDSFCLKKNVYKNFTFSCLKLQRVVTALGNAIPRRKGVFIPISQSRHSKWAHAELWPVITQTGLFHISLLNTTVFQGRHSHGSRVSYALSLVNAWYYSEETAPPLHHCFCGIDTCCSFFQPLCNIPVCMSQRICFLPRK